MRRRTIVVSVVVACQSVLFAGGCGSSYGPSRDQAESGARSGRLSGVAVVDLDEVAKQLGTDVALLKAIKDGQESLNQQLRTFQSSLQEKYRQKSQEQQPAPAANGSNSAPPKQQLVGLEREATLQLNEARRTAQNELNAYRQQLIQRFRNEVAPVAQEIAAQRGLGIVLTKNDSVLLSFDDAHNVTAAVVAKLRTTRATAQDASATVANRPSPTGAERR